MIDRIRTHQVGELTQIVRRLMRSFPFTSTMIGAAMFVPSIAASNASNTGQVYVIEARSGTTCRTEQRSDCSRQGSEKTMAAETTEQLTHKGKKIVIITEGGAPT